MNEEIQNIIDYIHGIRRDIVIFLKRHIVSDDCKNLLDRITYQLEQSEKMLEELI